jgi:galactokinase
VAILCAEDGRVGQFSYLPARHEASIPWPDTHRLVVAISGVMAHKTANALAAFNRLSDTLRADTADVVAGRSRRAQFREETETIVPGAAAALAARDWSAFGALVDRSQSLAESVLGNQVAETILLQRLAREQGAVAASAFGAGFGGAVWAMVPTTEAEDFGHRWRGQYLARFPEHADRCRVDITAPAAPACSLAI